MDFGRSDLKFVYAVPRDLQREGFLRGLWVAGAGIAMTLGAVSAAGLRRQPRGGAFGRSGLAQLRRRPAESADP